MIVACKWFLKITDFLLYFSIYFSIAIIIAMSCAIESVINEIVHPYFPVRFPGKDNLFTTGAPVLSIQMHFYRTMMSK